MKKVIKKKKIKKICLVLLLIILIMVFLFNAYKIFLWFKDNYSINKQMDEIKEIIDVESPNENDNADNEEIIESASTLPSLYETYKKTNVLNINFSKLKSLYPDTIGWINVSGTEINYPIVQANNNDFYLNHSINKSYNEGGWIFMDYRNNNFEDKNTLIYGHGRYNGTMFGELKYIIKNSWYKTSDYLIKISTEKENTVWQIFSVYHIPTTNDYLNINFTESNYKDFISLIQKRSQLSFNINVTPEDKIITLSTCYNNNEKMVVHAKLVKKAIRN